MEYTKLKDINYYKSENINPSKYPNEIFEMYSVPIYETGHPEYLRGEEIASSKSLVKKNDILLCKINPRINRVWIVQDESDKINIASSEWIVIRNDEYNPEFLAWYLRSPKFQKLMTSEVTGIGGSLTRAQPKRVAEYPVPVLSLREQNEIANALNKAKRIIDNRKKELSMLDDLIKARFVELFGKETEFDKWPCGTVGDVADVCVGVVIKPTQYYTDEGVPAFRSLNIGEMYVKDTDWVYFTEEGHLKNQKSVIRKNDVLVVRSGAPGTACVVTEKYDGYNAVDIIIAHPDNSKVNSVFLAAFTNMPHGMNQIRVKTGGAAQQHFNVGGYKDMRLILPPMKLQEEFAVFVQAIDKSKAAVQKALDETQVLFDSLMQKYFG